jgi:hypothetical protein
MNLIFSLVETATTFIKTLIKTLITVMNPTCSPSVFNTKNEEEENAYQGEWDC